MLKQDQSGGIHICDIGSGTTNASIDKKDSFTDCCDSHTDPKDTTSGSNATVPATAATPQSTMHPPLPGNTSTSEQLRLRKKPQNILSRSDSTGSSNGRKFLAPTLSDPQTIRSEKYLQKKKTGSFMNSGNSHTAGVSTPTRTSKHQIAVTSGLSIISSGVCLPTVNTISTGSASSNGAKYVMPTMSGDALTVANQSQSHQPNTIALSVCGLEPQYSTFDASINDTHPIQVNRNLCMENVDANRNESTIPFSHNVYGVDTSSELGHNLPANILPNFAATTSSATDTGIDTNTNVVSIFGGINSHSHVILSASAVTAAPTNPNQIGGGGGGGGGGGSSSTGSNVIGSGSKMSTGTVVNSGHQNVVFEVHDWWSDQAIGQQSSEDECIESE